MAFTEQSIMSQRTEFCILTSKPGSNISEFCRRFKITRRTGYKWLERYYDEGLPGLTNKSRRPHHFPNQTSEGIEKYVIKIRGKDQEWGSKKLHKIICNHKDQGLYTYPIIPCRATITKILGRNGLISPTRSKQSEGFERFEYDFPNELWQMDYKGYFKLLNKELCHPLTITDDHSRFNICLEACRNQQEITVKQALINVFRKYGLPYKILTDNGGPWGAAGNEPADGSRCYTVLEKWLIQLNIKLIHGRPYHPQTQGKEERFHRTLKQELLDYEQFRNHVHCQKRFDSWREKYNCIRPHEAINFKTPVELYWPSNKEYPEKMEPYEYNISDIKRKVEKGIISFKNKEIKVGRAFSGEYVALKKSQKDHNYEIYFCNQLIRTITL
ncbi:MAG: IS481 family transposase [Bacteroidia bacterium]|nr:IS481 family transposase [Bacteroidia bacterium]